MWYVKQIVYDAPAEEEAKAFERGLKSGIKAAAEFWRRQMAPDHFNSGAVGRYQYRPRSKKYMERKQNKFGHQYPLVFTGDSKRMILGTFSPARVSKFKSGGFRASIKLSAPKHFFQHQKNSPGQSKPEELKRIVPGEFDVLHAMVNEHIERELAKKRRARKVRKTAA